MALASSVLGVQAMLVVLLCYVLLRVAAVVRAAFWVASLTRAASHDGIVFDSGMHGFE